MVPEVLQRVIGRALEGIHVEEAILENHTRHHVKHADYPAVVRASVGAAILGRELTEDERCVRGCLVWGLTKSDVSFLDEFEGDEYVRKQVPLRLLSSNDLVKGEVYLYAASISRLSPSLWSLSDFMRDKAARWIGTEGAEEYAEVDRRRAMAGFITPPVEELPVFGKEFRNKYWSFDKGYTNVNHGSYGVAPNPVIDAYRAIQDSSNAAPDLFMRKKYMVELVDLRQRLATLVGCDKDDLVLVGNATTGVNTVLRSLTTVWEKGDKLLYFDTTVYDACSSTLQFIVDTHPHLSLQLVPISLKYPISHGAVLAALESTIAAEEERGGGKIKLALVDAISSNPGVIVPWEAITDILRKKGIISLIDAAHQVGQLPINLALSRPDFWVSNCHKWLLAHRGCAILYASKKYQYLMHSIPIGHSYALRTQSDSGSPDWVSEFEWNGTIDYSPVLSTSAALDFRAFCGGEQRINDYCHDLALKGGAIVAATLGTETMVNKEGEGELVANMINVRLPVGYPSDNFTPTEKKKILARTRAYLTITQLEKYQTIAPVFTHDNKWWTRLSAQVYNDIEDYRYVARVLKEVCAGEAALWR